jgi:hypothetical protein
MEVVNVVGVEEELRRLAEATTLETPQSPSLFPQDLGTTTDILNVAVEILMRDLTSNPDSPGPLSVVS